MKRLFLFSLIMAFLAGSTAAYAAQKASLGIGNIAVKADYISFTADEMEGSDTDTGLYLGIEGYGKIAPNLYLGAEIGYTNPNGNALGFDTELTFMPIELNLKYAVESTPNLAVDFGIGASYNYVEEKASGYGVSVSIDDWVFGGQIFADLNYKMDMFFIGINAKYQITGEPEYMGIKAGYDYSNWRIGGQVGLMF